MTHQEKQAFMRLKKENSLLKKGEEKLNKENRLLRKDIKEKEIIIKELDTTNYKEKFTTTSNENKELKKELKSTNIKLNVLNSKQEKLSNTINKKDNIITEKNNEIEDIKKKLNFVTKELNILKARLAKNSSNSSKPSSTNGFKHIITNRREKTEKSKGGQIGHKSAGLTIQTIEKIKETQNCKQEIVEYNKNNKNKNLPYKTRYSIDIEVITKITELRFYPDKNGKYNIPEKYNNIVSYDDTIKALSTMLITNQNMSTDNIKTLIEDVTNQGISVSKATLLSWENEAAKKLKPEIQKIEEKLLDSYYLNHDESQIKIDGKPSNLICAANKNYTRLWVTKSKSVESIEKLNFLNRYNGVIVKDGTNLYNKFGKSLAQCGSHILRYIKGIYDFVKHNGAKLMKDFFTQINNTRNVKISNNIDNFTDLEYNNILNEYNSIIKIWKKEWMSSNENSNPVYEEERKLLTRFEEDTEQILYFIKDFKVPFTNNQAETDLRPVKIKQKIGKFRSNQGAENYAIIRSVINTCKKQNINILDSLKQVFNNTLNLNLI